MLTRRINCCCILRSIRNIEIGGFHLFQHVEIFRAVSGDIDYELPVKGRTYRSIPPTPASPAPDSSPIVGSYCSQCWRLLRKRRVACSNGSLGGRWHRRNCPMSRSRQKNSKEFPSGRLSWRHLFARQ